MYYAGGRPPSQATRDAAAAGADAYRWHELCIGSRVHVYGRSMLIHDMDDATRTWFVNEGGLSPEQLAPIHVSGFDGWAVDWWRNASVSISEDCFAVCAVTTCRGHICVLCCCQNPTFHARQL